MARRAAWSFSNCRLARSGDGFFIWEGGDAKPWTTDQVVPYAVGSRRAVYFMLCLRRRARRRKEKGKSVVKKLLAFLLDFGRNFVGRADDSVHDDTLRANQGDPKPTFSFWRALVS
jgi:hypothetical protein